MVVARQMLKQFGRQPSAASSQPALVLTADG
jgi:hypothetical protein